MLEKFKSKTNMCVFWDYCGCFILLLGSMLSVKLLSIIAAEFCGRPSANGTSFWRGVTSAALFVFRGNPSVVAKDHGNGPKLYCSSSLTSIFRLWPMIMIRPKRDLSAFKTIVLPSVETFFFWLREEKVSVCSTWLCHEISSVVETIPDVALWTLDRPLCLLFERSKGL